MTYSFKNGMSYLSGAHYHSRSNSNNLRRPATGNIADVLTGFPNVRAELI